MEYEQEYVQEGIQESDIHSNNCVNDQIQGHKIFPSCNECNAFNDLSKNKHGKGIISSIKMNIIHMSNEIFLARLKMLH